jgi:hypothetical protein
MISRKSVQSKRVDDYDEEAGLNLKGLASILNE